MSDNLPDVAALTAEARTLAKAYVGVGHRHGVESLLTRLADSLESLSARVTQAEAERGDYLEGISEGIKIGRAEVEGRVTQAETTSQFEDWARSEEDFTNSTPWDYREGFRDAQKVALGLVEAWKTSEVSNG